MTPEHIEAVERTFGDRLAVVRLERGMTREGLALRAGLSKVTIEGIEQGRQGPLKPRRRPRLGEAVALARALGVQVAELLTPVGGAE